MKRLKKIEKLMLKTSFVLFATVLLFEIVYRFNVIDFYSSELNALNSSGENAIQIGSTSEEIVLPK